MKTLRLTLPNSTDIFVQRQTTQGLKALGEIIRHQERVEMLFELVVRMIVMASHRGVLERAIHAFDLPVGPRVVGFREAMVDTVVAAEAIKEMRGQPGGRAGAIAGSMTELTAVVRQDRVDRIGHGFDQGLQERDGDQTIGASMQLGIGKL